MIQVKRVKKAYGGESLLEDISFTLARRERLALVGRNGSGKTTLFRVITGQEEADSGVVHLPNNYRVGYLNQHIHFTKATILEEACLGLLPEDQEKVYKAEAILFGLGFQKDDLKRSPKEFSGGYFLRLHLAKLMLSEPNCLLLDEPTNYLDILSIRWLVKTLFSWPGELIVISHDRQFLDSVATHTAGIHRKRLKKIEGPTEKYYTQLAAEEQIHEKTRLGVEKKREHMQSFIDRFGAKNTKATQAQSRQKALNRLPSLEALCQIEDLHFRFPSKQTASKLIVRASVLSFSYLPELAPTIRDFSCEIERDARIGIIGQNGKGKSTLLRLLSGDLVATSGLIQPIPQLTVGYFGQSHIDRLPLDLTVEEEIKRTNPTLSTQEVRSFAGKMMFTQARAEKKIGVLSGGERSRVVLAQLLASPSHLLLLDEPTNHLDVESMEAFIDALEEFEGAVAIVTHSELVLERLAKELFVFKENSLNHFRGSYEEFLEKGGWDESEKPTQKKEQSQKDLRRQRAEAVTKRSELLRPHLTKIKSLEDQIITLESDVARLNTELLQAIESGFTDSIASHSRSLKEKQEKIENLFKELEEAHQRMEVERIELSS